MSRLLFAAARGARIETSYNAGETWRVVSGMVFDPVKSLTKHLQRIHPDDAHLQYGPVSTALREYAATNEWPYTLTALMAEAAFGYEKWYYLLESEWPHASTFALILAESLADEGL